MMGAKSTRWAVSEERAVQAWRTISREKDQEREVELRRALKLAREDGRHWGPFEPIKEAAYKYAAIMGAPTVLYCITHRRFTEHDACRQNTTVAPCRIFPKKVFDADDVL